MLNSSYTQLSSTSAPRYRPAPTVKSIDSKADGRQTETHSVLIDKLPLNPVDGIEVLKEHDYDAQILLKLVVHYTELGAVASSSFAILFSNDIVSQSGPNASQKILRVPTPLPSESSRTTSNPSSESKQGEIVLPSDEN
ncbi:MAG: hypothetical protein ACI9XK_000094 [Granulosicoccus sp.]